MGWRGKPYIEDSWKTSKFSVKQYLRSLVFKSKLYQKCSYRVEFKPPEDGGGMWGKKVNATIYTGLFGDMAHSRKDFGVANLFITPFVTSFLDMTMPYQIV